MHMMLVPFHDANDSIIAVFGSGITISIILIFDDRRKKKEMCLVYPSVAR